MFLDHIRQSVSHLWPTDTQTGETPHDDLLFYFPGSFIGSLLWACGKPASRHCKQCRHSYITMHKWDRVSTFTESVLIFSNSVFIHRFSCLYELHRHVETLCCLVSVLCFTPTYSTFDTIISWSEAWGLLMKHHRFLCIISKVIFVSFEVRISPSSIIVCGLWTKPKACSITYRTDSEYANADIKGMQSKFRAYDRMKLSPLICATIQSLETVLAAQLELFLSR